MRQLNCPRCDSAMEFLMREKFQKGESGAWVGNLNFSFRGGFEMDVYSCPRCSRLEFFLPREEEPDSPDFDAGELPPDSASDIVSVSRDGIPQVRCRACGRTYDFDFPKCPHCDFG